MINVTPCYTLLLHPEYLYHRKSRGWSLLSHCKTNVRSCPPSCTRRHTPWKPCPPPVHQHPEALAQAFIASSLKLKIARRRSAVRERGRSREISALLGDIAIAGERRSVTSTSCMWSLSTTSLPTPSALTRCVHFDACPSLAASFLSRRPATSTFTALVAFRFHQRYRSTGFTS